MSDQTNPQHFYYGQRYAANEYGNNLGQVWQPYAFGGGEWRVPQVVALREEDIGRIAREVVRLLKEEKLTHESKR